MDRLSSYPYVIVRISCDLCRRRGSYRLARLASRLGPECPMDEVMKWVTRDCVVRDDPPRHRSHRRMAEVYCRARFIDLQGPPTPPDVPPMMLKLRVVGGRDE